jgi:hypothetical protein
MARHKEFGSVGVFRPEDLEEISFTLLGETFKCRPILPGTTLVRVIQAAESPSGGVATIMELFKDAVVPEDFGRFTEIIEGTDTVVSMEGLVAILEWLIEQYAERPTMRPSSSENGLQTTGLTSEDGISSTPEVQA